MVAVTADEVSPIVVGSCTAHRSRPSRRSTISVARRTGRRHSGLGARPTHLVPFVAVPPVSGRDPQFDGAWSEAIVEARRAQELAVVAAPGTGGRRSALPAGRTAPIAGRVTRRPRWPTAGQANGAGVPSRVLRCFAWPRADRSRIGCDPARRKQSPDGIARARLLEAQVEIALAVSERDQAGGASEALSRIAGVAGAPLLTAIARRAERAVLMAEGNPRGALGALRDASAALEKLDAPYERARVRVWIGQALRQLGDADSAELELDGARRAFLDLGAAPDLARMDVVAETSPSRPLGLSAREIEVLRLVAAGATNRAIAADLGSASERSIGTSATSSRSSMCRRDRRRPRTPTSMASAEGTAAGTHAHARLIGYFSGCGVRPTLLRSRWRPGSRPGRLRRPDGRIGVTATAETIERVETLIIGAGQAGLAAGYHLSKRGRPFLIVDANERIGDQWRRRWVRSSCSARPAGTACRAGRFRRPAGATHRVARWRITSRLTRPRSSYRSELPRGGTPGGGRRR